MAITGSSGIRAGAGSGGIRRKGASANRSGSFAPVGMEPLPTEAAPQPAAVYAPCLLAMQEDEPGDPGREGRAQALRRGNDVLDRLEELRRALIAGFVAPARLKDLARTLQAERMACDDPRLEDLIAEIELRAEVELAKLARRPSPAKHPSGSCFRQV